MALLGSSWLLLGSSWLSKWVRKWLQIDPRWAILANKRHRLSLPELSKNFCFFHGSKMVRDGPERPKITSWEPSWDFRGCLGRPWPPKTFKNKWFLKVFVNAGFRYFEALGSSGADLVPRRLSK